MLRVALPMSRMTMLGRTMSSAAGVNVGFIGLGNMGGSMAANLVKAGNNVTVFDLSDAAMAKAEADGAKTASGPAEVAAQSNTIITMLPSSPHVYEVFTGEGGILSTMQPNTLCIDSSTIDPAMSQKVAEIVTAAGSEFLDAPVSGGVGGAAAGTLTFMVGGPEASFQRASDALDAMGSNVVHCGAVGTGQAAKICNNMMLGISMIGASETMNLGVRLGMDPKLLTQIMATATARCWALDTYNPCPGVFEGVPASNGYAGGFGSALMNKDLGLAMDAAKANDASTPLGQLANQIYTQMSNEGWAEKDFSSAYEWLQKK